MKVLDTGSVSIVRHRKTLDTEPFISVSSDKGQRFPMDPTHYGPHFSSHLKMEADPFLQNVVFY